MYFFFLQVSRVNKNKNETALSCWREGSDHYLPAISSYHLQLSFIKNFLYIVFVSLDTQPTQLKPPTLICPLMPLGI